MTYSEKLKSPKWQRKRLKIFDRDGWKCNWCNDEETQLHVHHLKYTGKNPEDAPDKDLITLCAHCHGFYEALKQADGRDMNVLGAFKTRSLTCNGRILIFKCPGGNLVEIVQNDKWICTSVSNETIKKFIDFFNG